jgi:protein involved in polysaccharide export with SLBB domain
VKNVLITVAVGLALNLPNTVLGQRTQLAVQPGDLIELRIGGAVHNAGLFSVDPTVTLSEALATAGGPAPLGQGDKVWVFRDGEIITTILGGDSDCGLPHPIG